LKFSANKENLAIKVSAFVPNNAAFMRILTTIFFIFNAYLSSGQQKDTTMQNKKDGMGPVTFVAIFDERMATKDGYYLDDYVVNIDPARAKKLSGRKIRITGVVSIVQGLDNQDQEVDANGKPIVKQGRSKETRYINDPQIQIVQE